MVGERDARAVALQHLGGTVGPLREVPGGYGHATFIVDEAWVFRFARSAAVGEQDRVERRVLPLIERSVSFSVPRLEFAGTFRGLPYVGYRMVPGRPLRSSDVPVMVSAIDLGELLHELHLVPPEHVAAVVGAAGTRFAWQERYRELRRSSSALHDVVPRRLLANVESAFERFFAASFDFVPVVVHGDLGTSHILLDEQDVLVGLIDFEAVQIGDPAIDFVGFLITLGPELCGEVIDAYPGRVDEGFRERVLGYWWIGSLHAVLHGVDTGDATIIGSGVNGLGERLSNLSNFAAAIRGLRNDR